MQRITVSVALIAALPIVSAHGATQSFSRWLPLCEGSERAGGIALGDVDGDGDLDIVFANGQHLGQKDWVLSNDGRGSFYARRALARDALAGDAADPSYGVALGDVDGDGALDVVIANDVGAPSMVYRNDGRGNFTWLASLGTGGQPRRAVALGDLDQDGDLDAVLVGLGQDHIYFNENGRRWTEQILGSSRAAPMPGQAGRATATVLSDLDGDGDLDIVVPGRYEAENRIFMNDGKGGFSDIRRFGVGSEDAISVAVGDVDGDGDPDIVLGNWEQSHVVYANDGHAEFTRISTFGTGHEQTWAIALGDMDLDGDLDVVAGNVNVGFWGDDLNGDGSPDRFGRKARNVPSRVYVNDGYGRFVAGVAVTTGSEDTRPIAVGDVDRDGDLDVIMGNTCQPNYVFFNSLRVPKAPVLDSVLTETRQRWGRAAATGDKVTYSNFLSDDAIWVDFTGTVGNKASLSSASLLRATGGETDVRQYPSAAVILGERGGGVLRHVQVWLRDGDRWLMAATQEVRVGSRPITLSPPMTAPSPLPASSGTPNDLQAIQTTLRELEAGIKTRNVKSLATLTTPEFVAMSAIGQMQNRDDWMTRVIRDQALDINAGSIEANSTRIHGELGISNRIFRSEDQRRVAQTLAWVKRDGKWALSAIVNTLIEGSIDRR